MIIVATDRRGRVLTVRQYRHGSGKIETELPAGDIERGESLIKTAKRELLEETGFTSDEFGYVGKLISDATRDLHRCYIVRTTSIKKAGKTSFDLDESISRPRLLNHAELIDAVNKRKLRDSMQIAALILSGVLKIR